MRRHLLTTYFGAAIVGSSEVSTRKQKHVYVLSGVK